MVPVVIPMQPTLARAPFHRPGWVYETKYDGWRMVAYKDGAHYAGARYGASGVRLEHSGQVVEVKAERLSELTARMPVREYPPETLVDEPLRVSLQLSGCTDHFSRIKHSPACSVEQIGPDSHRLVTRLDGQAAMNALRSVHDGGDVTATAPATIVTVKASTFQEHRSDVAHLAEADGARAPQAGLTYRDAGSIDEQSAHLLNRCHRHRVTLNDVLF